ncbi:hypothetical protein NQ315_000146 [Exocentrus adspersus]|uniref:Major facilitator superfamily (MFS) profile domain-containing protein n=1 Tax=Exocentrus adspersus TaxID=1586481 RepID=A0AAV8VQQ7_9CUCU|nr:hypothetical protein NQ315_000146 [Exocentrus adspersus]
MKGDARNWMDLPRRICSKLAGSDDEKQTSGNKSGVIATRDFSPRLRQCYVTLGVILISISLGMVEGYSAILLPQLEDEGVMVIDYEMSSWIASIATLPTPLGCALGGLLMETIGRKTIHMLVCIPCLVGWIVLYFSTTTTHLLVGRFTTGVAVAHVFGTFTTWQNTALVGCVFPLACLAVMVKVPESPTFLAKKSKVAQAKEAFYWCRGYGEAAELELQELLSRQSALLKLPRKTIKEYVKNLTQNEFLKPLSILTVYFLTLQWTGINALTFYNVDIIEQILDSSSNVYTSMLVMDAVRLATSVLACYLMKRIGRRPHTLLSGIGTTTTLLILSAFCFGAQYWPQLKKYSVVALVVLIAYMAFVTVGLLSIPWAMMGGTLPFGAPSGLAALINYAFIFSVVKPTPWLLLNFGAGGTFLVYATAGLLGTGVLSIFLPETKNKPLHEIEDGFKEGT